MKKTLSLCMIVRNEEDVLARCLDSIRNAVDEIIIIDTGSEDKTVEIAHRYTEHIYFFEWEDNFSDARNYSFSKASGDYILWLDADDVVPVSTAVGIAGLMEMIQADIVMLPYQVGFDGSGQANMIYERERIIRRQAGFEWHGAVHEAIVPNGLVLHLSLPIRHEKLHPSAPGRNLRIYEKLLLNGHILGTRDKYYYARELYYNGRSEEALEAFSDFLACKDAYIENKLDAYRCLAQIYREKGETLRASQLLLESFLYEVPRAEALCDLGEICLDNEAYGQAMFWYKAALQAQRPKDGGAFICEDSYGFIPAVQLCVCYDRLGDKKEALIWHEKAKAIKSADPAVLYNEEYFYQAEKNNP